MVGIRTITRTSPNIWAITSLKSAITSGDAVLSAKGQYNWNTGYGGAELGLSYPITKHVRLYTQVYSGYGESLIDYNFNQTRVGVGVMLNDLF
ncbi:phospholipase A1 (detergent resistant phospholipase A) [Escherichia coli]|nr:phospholipase A1 (detergent resistant phospholipase A) [Escherichia coli]